MEAIRTKDKLFLAAVVPAALVAAYAYLWRADAVRRVEALRSEDAALVAVGDFPLERASAERRLAAARAALDAERRVPAPAVRVRAKAEDGIAARERAVLEVFRLARLAVERSGNAENGDGAAGAVLARTGFRPAPVCRRYEIRGSYPDVCTALRTIAGREMAVVPDRVEMTAPGRWTLTVWL